MSKATLTQHTETNLLPRGSDLEVSDSDLRRASLITMVINGLAAGMTIDKACVRADVSLSTWRRWRTEGDVMALLQTKFEDVTAGVRDLVAESLVPSTKVLTSLAKGEIPSGTAINGVLAPRDVIAAQQQLMNLWKVLGGSEDPGMQENQRVIDELKKRAVSITTYNIDTVNVGSEAQPMPVATGVRLIDVDPQVLDAPGGQNGH